ncbi:hypothetical protein [Polyangium fumosum]|uniref:Uncharacterized protein n=1 Tax=Polyangium fumosum TaxID=889272 RepID=A0A4U1J332_9BACT|nr:hypothetical protein [Polyangium fumosum]TKD00816.1 hypothetical protein E8A74_33380 [Polyangium fumosum]
MGRRSLLRFLAAALLAALPGCLSPTLPLPPPEPPDSISPQAATPGLWTVSGACLEGAIVIVFNERTGAGAVVEDRDRDGRYEVQIEAELCDLAWVAQDLGEDESARTTFVVQDRTPSGLVDPSACK